MFISYSRASQPVDAETGRDTIPRLRAKRPGGSGVAEPITYWLIASILDVEVPTGNVGLRW